MIDLQSLLLGGGYQWEANSPATEDAIAALVSACPVELPSEYLALLRLSDGGTASLSGYPSYVRIWPAQTAVEYNRDYEVERWLPGFVGFGDNGGPDMVGFDTRSSQPYRVCAIPFAPMEWEAAMGEVADFSAFIRQLLPSESKQAEPEGDDSMPRSQYLIDIPSLHREFPPTIPVPPLLDEFAQWLRERDIYLGALRLHSERLDDAGASGLGDLCQCFAPFIRTSCGSVVALWLPDGTPLASPPVVRIGSEGDNALLGDSLEDFFWRLAARKTGDEDLDTRDEQTGDGGAALSQWLESRDIKPARRRRWPDFAVWWRKRQKAYEKWCDHDSLRLSIAENLRTIRPFAKDAEPWETATFDAVIVGSRLRMWQRVQGPQPLNAAQVGPLGPLLRADRERRAKEVPERGLWFQAFIIVAATGGAHIHRDYMSEPRVGDEQIPIPVRDYRDDLARFPRSDYWMPDWLKSKTIASPKARSATTKRSKGPGKTELGYDQTGPGRRPPWCVWGQDVRAVAVTPFWNDDKSVLLWGIRDAKAPDGFSLKHWRIKSDEQQAGAEEFINAADFRSWRDLTALQSGRGFRDSGWCGHPSERITFTSPQLMPTF